MVSQIKLKAFFFAEGNGCVPFLVFKIHDQILETDLSHMRYMINNIDWYTVKQKVRRKKFKQFFIQQNIGEKKTVLVHLCTTSICLAVKTFIKRVWAIVQQHLPLPEIINAWEALFLVLWKANVDTCI